MNENDIPEIVYSPLCRTIEREGQSVDVEIYEDGEGKWILEVMDIYGNSTVWSEHFKTDRDALEEVVKTIYSEGIDVLIGSDSDEIHSIN